MLIKELRALLGEIGDFIRDDFSWPKYTFALVLIVALDVLQIHYDIFSLLILPHCLRGTGWMVAPLYYLALYYVMLVPTTLMSGERWRLRQWQLWVWPAVLICLQGASQYGAYYRTWFLPYEFGAQEERFLSAMSPYLFRSLTVLCGICLFRWLTQRRFALFGLTLSGRYLRLYALGFACMFPFLFAASMTEDFLSYYPCFKFWQASGAFGLADWQMVGLFDASYILDYLSVECIFRGAFIIGLARWLGPRCVLPMVIVYVGIHVGKPYVEMCSAAVGGYLLGILAYRTQHLWGGIFAHVAIAISMEVLASMWHLL